MPEAESSGRPRLLADRCSSCVFRPGNLMHLAEGRLRDLVDSNLDAGAVLTCHATLHRDDVPEAMCRGFYDAYGEQVNVVRVMRRLAALAGLGPDEWYVEVPPPVPA